MTDLLNDEDFWTTGIVLDEPTDMAPDEARPAYDGLDEDDAYGWDA